MNKRINAYMSVESGVIFSITILLFYLVIISSSLLLDRCLLAQNDYVIALRGAMFSNSQEGYGQIIYGSESSFDREEYMLKRLKVLRDLYIFFPINDEQVKITPTSVKVISKGRGMVGNNEFECECRMNNPVMRIRECRY